MHSNMPEGPFKKRKLLSLYTVCASVPKHYKLTEIIDRIFILDIRTRDTKVILG